jgi:hypothetical protein
MGLHLTASLATPYPLAGTRPALDEEVTTVSIPGSDGLGVGERLPALTLETVAGRTVDLNLARHASSVVVLPHPHCGDCLSFLHRLDELADELSIWDGLPLAVVSEEAEARALAEQLPFPVLFDRDARARRRAGIPEDGAAVLVADRFGTVYRSDRDHRFPDSREIVSEVRFIGIQCPECGVPDEPPGGQKLWAS